MKKMLITGLALLLANFVFGQHITESPLTLNKSYASLFNPKSSVISMALRRDFDLNQTDTTYSFMITVNETEREVNSVSIGFSSFNAGRVQGSSTGIGANISIDRRDGFAILMKPKFLELYKCVNEVYKVVGTMAAMKKGINAMCTCEVDDVQFGGEFIPSYTNEQRYYFRLGEAVFSMSKVEFEELVKFVREVRLVIETK